MIVVYEMTPYPQLNPSMFRGLEREIFVKKQNSPIEYRYQTVDQLSFELRVRAETVEASRALFQSHASFATFEDSRCNPAYWQLTREGGFRLRPNMPSSMAIRDIFLNGRLYAFECAVAMVIVLYKAVLETIGDDLFNQYFARLYLYSWHYDSDLRLTTIYGGREMFAGDIVYFKNPEFDPATPEWQGENAVKMNEVYYFGHGIGIVSEDRMIAELNMHRRRGAYRSAYLLDQTTNPDYVYLYRISTGREPHPSARWERPYADRAVIATIGAATHIIV